MRFLFRSLLILLALYGLVFAVVDAYLARSGAPLWIAVLWAVAVVGVQYVIGPWLIEWLLDIAWADHGPLLPAVNQEFIERLCAERGLKVPRIGIIYSGTPNAFSFGRLRSDARVVVSKGLIDVLTPEETNAVLAHEIGHIEHWDFAVMTIAALAPLLLYQLYVFTRRIKNARVIAYTAYLCYLLSQFIVLLLNRTREYFADHYAGEVTGNPDALSSALVRIAYGMVRADGEYRRAIADGDAEEKKQWGRERRLGGAVALMGISGWRSGAALALGGANPSEAAAVMRWDLVNPWARLYELNSTHPLTALRVRELNRQTEALHRSSQYSLPRDRHIEWGNFPVEFLVWAAPLLSGAVLVIAPWLPSFLGVVLPSNAKPLLLAFTGLAWILRVSYRYCGEFKDASIGALIEDVEVSQMRPRAVRLKGKILGRGMPGAFWSPDLVLRDSTGIMFILYRQSIPFARLLFATTAAENYIGQEVEVEGWFRRGLVPYVEMSRLKGKDSTTHRAYSRWVQYALAGVAVVVSWLWLSSN
ncbi:MAG: hypothetical protein DMG27_20280 [Acidobacteria bacterium]|nr:MAG: hypothetical protein DMG27_20280 [Acidobacteriota bacterium]